ncbi:hypothetical protein [Prevotella dentalis]|uniref:hypothetical protein n=1 Tax=Prevotella dentalis TaxID=52227 RepID=UPI00265ADF2F|nr:hypothetical protein [Prevotella dentalis]MCF2636909.1 hypothetical protein [Prevotella dentalis]
MASKTAGAAEKLNGGSGKMEDVAEKTGDVAEKTEDAAEKTEDVCDKFAPMSQVVGTRVAQLFAQAGDVQMVSKQTAWNGRKRDDGRRFCLKMLQK